MKFQGRIVSIGDVQTGTSKAGKDWKKQDVVLEEEGAQYPDSMSVTFFNKEINFSVGDLVTITFNIKATEYNGRYFNNLSAFNWEVIGDSQKKNQSQQPMSANDMPSAPITGQSGFGSQSSDFTEPDNLPF